MKNVHLIATDKPSRLRIGNNGNLVFGITQISIVSKNDSFTNQHIYITSDEDIKEGDWVITYNGLLAKVITELTWHLINSKKIILTTDQELMNDGVRAIDDEFFEWFVNNSSCEEVKVYYDLFEFEKDSSRKKYIINIPKEEPKQGLNLPLLEQKLDEALSNETEESLNTWLKEKRDKQETIEEVAKNESAQENGLMEIELNHTKTLLESCEKALEERDKQQERSYTDEDIKLEKVIGSKYCQFSTIENKLEILYRNQEQILKAIKLTNK